MGTDYSDDVELLEHEVDTDSMNVDNWYVKELAKYSVYSQEKLEELFKKYYETNDKDIRDEIVLHNGRLVVWEAKKWVNSGVSIEDLCQYGVLGLMRAVNEYKLDKGTKFSTYAIIWIKQSIRRNIVDNESVIRPPVWLKTKAIKARSYIQHCVEDLDYTPSDDEICEYLELSSEQYKLVKDYELNLSEVLSSDFEYNAKGFDDPVTLGSTLVDSHLCETDALFNELSENMDSLMKLILLPREYEILCLRTGFNESREHTLEECAGIYGVTRERIRQIEEKAFRKLRRSGRFKHLKDYWEDL